MPRTVMAWDIFAGPRIWPMTSSGGANRELMPVLEMLRRDRLRTTMVLGLRDIIDDPEVTCPLWQREGVYETLEQYYDWGLVYGSPHVFPTAEKYRVPSPVSEK